MPKPYTIFGTASLIATGARNRDFIFYPLAAKIAQKG